MRVDQAALLPDRESNTQSIQETSSVLARASFLLHCAHIIYEANRCQRLQWKSEISREIQYQPVVVIKVTRPSTFVDKVLLKANES